MHTSARTGLFFFLFCCFHFSLTENATAQFPQLHFENLTTQNGLSNNNITCLYQDKKGFLWVGTANGLNKYDGNIFQTFYAEEGNQSCLSGNSIVQILEDAGGIFWIATRDGGLTRYDPAQYQDKQFTQIKNIPGDSTSLPSNRMTAICDYNEDYLLIGAEKMMLGFLNKKTLQLHYLDFNAGDTAALHISIEALPAHPANKTWIHHITSDERYIYFSLLTPDFIYSIERSTNTLQIQNTKNATLSIPTFMIDQDTIWLASWNKGLYYQPNTAIAPPPHKAAQKKVPLIDAEITAIEDWNADILLVSTSANGLYCIDKKTFLFETLHHDRADKNSIADNRIHCIFHDRGNIWWFGTAGGLSKFNPVQWQFVAQEIKNNDERELNHFGIYEDAENTLRLCTSEGIYKKSGEENAFHLIRFHYQNHVLQPTQIYHLADGAYFMNTETNTFHYTPGSETISLLRPAKYMNDAVADFFSMDPMQRGSYQVRFLETDTIAKHSVLIFGTMGWGLGVYDISENIYYDLINSSQKKSIQNNLVRVLFKDAAANFWVGTAEGLYQWNKSIPAQNDFEKYTHTENDASSISGNSITGIYQDRDRHFWITTNNGLNAFDPQNNIGFQHYLPAFANSKNMYGIFADASENLWIGVSGGFEVFSIKTKTFQHIDLPNAEWSFKYPAQILKRKSGEWMYGAGNNLISFYPDAFYFDTVFPDIYLTDFAVFDKSILHTEAFDHLQFNYNNNFFTINFSSLQLSQSGAVKYQYSLEGLNTEWTDLGSIGKIIFTSLPPGKYTLLVKATNAQGTWGPARQLIAFTVAAPYWRQWWFYVLCIFALCLLIYSVIRYRERQFLKLQSVRNKIANDLHDEVGSALSTINLYSEVAKMKSAAEDEALKNILDKISNTSLEMQENMSHIVWNLQPRNDNFKHMILHLKSYAIENLQTKNIITTFFADPKLEEIKLLPDQRKEFFLIYKEAIHNILKYAQCTETKIEFSKSRNLLILKIEDNGIGFNSRENFAGNGLHTMQERAKTLHGTLEIRSAPQQGTSITLQFPL